VIRLAREEILPHDGGVDSERKGDGSLLTAVDQAMQRRLADELARDWPDVPVLGEESTAEEQDGVLLAGCMDEGTPFWCPDPLDGTSNFVLGFSAYPVSVALVDLKGLPASLAVRVACEHSFRSRRNLGSAALEWCWVAAGRCPVHVHGRQKPWDYPAGMLILREAGSQRPPVHR